MAEQKTDACAVQICIKQVPEGTPSVDDFELVPNVQLSALKENELLIEMEYISVDPYQRMRIGIWFKTPSRQMQSFSVAKVLKSTDPKYKAGDYVKGTFGWCTKGVVPSSAVELNLSSVQDEKSKIPRSYYIGVLGLTGVTAYYGMLIRGGLKKGENVLISGAAGGVGFVCGQIAKLYGCYVVGICGTEAKQKWLTEELGFDATINYKQYKEDGAVAKVLQERFPKGIDLYFDNVGGIFTENVWEVLNRKARVVVCGQISKYNTLSDPKLIKPFLFHTIYKSIDIRGLFAGEFTDYGKFFQDMGEWIASGKIKNRESVVEGFENTPAAFVSLFSSKNTGKTVVKCV